MGVEPKIGGKKPKMDGEKNGSNPMNKWMIWKVFPIYFYKTPFTWGGIRLQD